MLPDFRTIMKELVDDQRRTSNRIRVVDDVPNCKSWQEFPLLLTRGQEVVNDKDVKVVYRGKSAAKQPSGCTPAAPKAALPEHLPKDQASMPLGGLSSDETFTPCEGDQCDKQIGYDKVEFDKKGWSTPKWCHGCKQIRNAASLAANSAGPGSSAGGGSSNLAVIAGESAVDSDDELPKSLTDADGSKTVHFELFGAGILVISEIID